MVTRARAPRQVSAGKVQGASPRGRHAAAASWQVGK
jgi:hypothetical protein